jgi:hypothetical protein
MLAPVMGPVPPGFQRTMEELLEHIARRRELEAVALVRRWFERVDAELVAVLETAVTTVRTVAERKRGSTSRRERDRQP